MSVGSVAYNVLTEFRFEIGGALLGTKQLQDSVNSLSNAADGALLSFERASLGIVAQFGLGAGGIAGTILTALKAADKFKMSQIALANLMGQGLGFDERMAIASEHMAEINRLANEFGLPADELLNLTKLTAPMMRNEKGLPDFRSAMGMSRDLMKAAPTLGVDTNLVAGQLQSAISGHASMGDTLFQRLVADTMEMKGQTSQSFNGQDEHKRITMLRKALGEFTRDTKVLEANVNTLNGQMTLLKNNISGTMGILSQIGQTIMSLVIPSLNELNDFLKNEGQTIAKNIAHGLQPWMDGGWRNLVSSLMQVKSLFGDVQTAKNIVTFVASIVGLNDILKKLKITIPIVSSALKVFTSALHFLERDLLKGALTMKIYGKTGVMMANGGIGGFIARMAFYGQKLAMLISRFFAPLALLIIGFQLLSRAAAIGKIMDFDTLKKSLPIVSETIALISRLIAFLNGGFNRMAEIIAPVFQTWLFPLIDEFANFLKTLFTGFGIMIMIFEGVTLAIFELFAQIKSLLAGDGFSFSKIGEAFNFGMDETYQKIFGKIGDGTGATSNQITNINKVEINNAFKENAQPDRIAFTMKEQILKAAANPSQGGKSMQGALISR